MDDIQRERIKADIRRAADEVFLTIALADALEGSYLHGSEVAQEVTNKAREALKVAWMQLVA